MIDVRIELPKDAAGIYKLLDQAFGSKRHRKTVYRLREGVLPIRSLCFVAEYMSELRGSLRFWPILINDTDQQLIHNALLLGPLAVDPGIRGRGVGEALMRNGLKLAQADGHERVILVGDLSYYGVFGFKPVSRETLSLPGPVDQNRLLSQSLIPGAVDGVKGRVIPAVPLSARPANAFNTHVAEVTHAENNH